MRRTIILAVAVSILGLMILSGCIQPADKKEGNISEVISPEIKFPELGTTQELKKFSSPEEIREFLKNSSFAASGRLWGDFGVMGKTGMAESVPIMGMPMPAATAVAVTAVPAPESGTSDYSKTNIQVEGVDEADFVKNDGKYIYILSQNQLVIVDAFPADKANILSETKIPGRPRELFLNDDRLVVFTEDDHEVMTYSEYDYIPRPRYTQNTSALIYDVSDRKKPQRIDQYSINGNYFRSRMIGDYVYFIVTDNAYYSEVIDVPAIMHGTVKIMAPDVYYFDNPEENYMFHTIASINLKTEAVNAKSFIMGYSDNLYVSTNNIYITYRKNPPYGYYQEIQKERFYKVVVPLLPKDVQDKINDIKNSSLTSYEKWEKISSILEETYNRMSEKEKQDFFKDVDKAIEEYDVKLAQESDKTVIQKFGIDKGDIEYKAKGEVPGNLLNQFSMDEDGDHFRVATTTQLWVRGSSVMYNNVYVMDKDLALTGKLEEIAPDESIYSTRFIGKRLYMVTFKRMDPLFVIDLSDPEAPKILGKLKIPGFSDYLHPYDDTHLIGIGKETGENEWGGVSIKGVKLSLFDVSDVEKPRQIDVYEIGKAGTDSEALTDHRAFLFDKNKNLLVIPIREVGETENMVRYPYRQKIWLGAYVFGVTPEDGFKLKGKISHFDEYQDQVYYWDGGVRRSLYMDDVLYTISAKKIMMNSLKDISSINSVDLPLEMPYYEYGWK